MHGNMNVKFVWRIVVKYISYKLFRFTIYHTVRLLSFRTGIIKSICVKETTLLLFSFRHTSLLTVHTDLHGHTASGCLCRSRPLQWCLMCLSRLVGCPIRLRYLLGKPFMQNSQGRLQNLEVVGDKICVGCGGDIWRKVRQETFSFNRNGTGRLVSTNGDLAYMSDAILKLTHTSERNHSTQPSLHDSI